jgi:hypothetical protein
LEISTARITVCKETIMKPQHLKESQAAARKAHFAVGGTPQTWRGRAQTLDGARSKARKNKDACRDWKEET